MENQNSKDDYFCRVLKSNTSEGSMRLAVILEKKIHTFLLTELRNMCNTYVISNFKELSTAFAEQEKSALISLDLREMSEDDVSIFAKNLENSVVDSGIVYVMTAAQFKLFENVNFDFVYK